MAYTPDLDALLTVGARFVCGDTTYVVEMHPLDDVVLPTGQGRRMRSAGIRATTTPPRSRHTSRARGR